MKIESQWTPEALYRLVAGVNNFFWFSLFDPDPTIPSNESLESGLYFWAPAFAERQPKEVLFAFRFPFVALPREKGLFIWGRTPASTGGKFAIQAQKGGKWRNLAIIEAGTNGMFSTTLKSHYGKSKKGAVRATYLEEASIPFPMRPVGDSLQPPFGKPVR